MTLVCGDPRVMALPSVASLLGYCRRITSHSGPHTDDTRFLTRPLAGDDSPAADLVNRHAALVWGTCCRVLGASSDAEDAFQATFVVLLEKAGSLGDGRPLGPWLHRVASRAAVKIRLVNLRQSRREASVVSTANDQTDPLEQHE